MKFFIGIFLCFFVFSSAGVVIEDMTVNSPYVSCEDCAYTYDEENKKLPIPFSVIDSPVQARDTLSYDHIEMETPSFAQNQWNHDSANVNEDDSHYSRIDRSLMKNPYAPFPWPCDSFADCAYTYEENKQFPTPTLFNESDSMNSPYAPFPWPCDSFADCAYTYEENKQFPTPQFDSMKSPYVPFPWPCDSFADCAYTYEENKQFPTPTLFNESDSMNSPYAPLNSSL